MKKAISLMLIIVMLMTSFSITTSAATLRNLDLAFVIDTTGSMGDDIAVVKKDMLTYLEQLNETDINYRVAIVDYRDFASRTGDRDDYPYMVQLDFTDDEEIISEKIKGLSLGYGGDTNETVYSALIDGLSELSWRNEAGKAVILMGDAPALDPEPTTNYTLLDVYKTLKISNLIAPQTSVVPSYDAKNAAYEDSYFKKAGKALDGTEKTPHMCVPGLASGEYMVPQGLGYCAETDSVLVSSYYKKDTSDNNTVPSKIYSLDYFTGKLDFEYNLVTSEGKPHTGHVGGIAVSGKNVYIASGKYIYYVPLSNFNKETGTATIKSSYKVSELMNDASCAYVTITDNVLWTGNFYDSDSSTTKASKKANSVVLGFKLDGTGDAAEWKSFKNSKADYKINIDKKIENIQCATVKSKKLYISQSYGRKKDSHILLANVTPSSSVTVKKSSFTSVKALPMMEGFFIKDNSIYTVFESASNFYMNGVDGKGNASYPTDVIWKIDCSKLTSKKTRAASTTAAKEEPITEVAPTPIGNIVVFTINTSGSNSTAENFKKIADVTGGRYYTALKSSELSDVIEEIIVEIPEIVEDEVTTEYSSMTDLIDNLFLNIYDLFIEMLSYFEGIIFPA